MTPKHDSHWPNSKFWKEKAEEARTIAEGFADPSAKATMLNVAAIYDAMAQRAKAREEQAN